jgi:hypothetical protein
MAPASFLTVNPLRKAVGAAGVRIASLPDMLDAQLAQDVGDPAVVVDVTVAQHDVCGGVMLCQDLLDPLPSFVALQRHLIPAAG